MIYFYHRLTRADTVLTGRNAPILRHAPWKYGKYSLRGFPCPDTFLLRQNCFAPAGDAFSSDFWLSSRRRAGACQGEKGKKRRKDTPEGVFALVYRWYYLIRALCICIFSRFQRVHEKRLCIFETIGCKCAALCARVQPHEKPLPCRIWQGSGF